MANNKLNIIVGCMFSGKTSELLRECRRRIHNNQKVLAINYIDDKRYTEEDFIVSHNLDKIKCIRAKYLNDVPEEAGGATFFPKINLRVQPKSLDAIYFENMNNNELDYNTLHAGEPILTDVKKFAINIWLREKDF
jgi:thymidine kinase